MSVIGTARKHQSGHHIQVGDMVWNNVHKGRALGIAGGIIVMVLLLAGGTGAAMATVSNWM